MKKWSWLLGIVLFLITGCGTIQEEQKKPEEMTSLFTLMENENEKQKEIVQVEELQGLKEVLEPKEVPLVEINNVLNNKIESVFHIDEMTGVVYFVNFNKDWHIYRMKDGEAEKAVPLPANNLCMYDGSLYFMIEFYNTEGLSNVKEGDIYCYTPSTGEVKLIYSIVGEIEGADVSYSKLKVRETGIHFTYTIKELSSDGVMRDMIKEYYLPFEETEPIKDDSFGTYVQWKDYYLASSDGYNMVFFHKDDWNNQILISDTAIGTYFIVGDNFYYIDGAKICVKNLETGVQEDILDFYEVLYQYYIEFIKELGLTPEEVNIGLGNFTITNNGETIWFTCGSLYCYHTKTKEIVKYTMPNSEIQQLFTDGTYLYADATSKLKLDDNYGMLIYPFMYDLNRVYTENDIMEMEEELKEEFEYTQWYETILIYMVKPVTE